MGELESSLIYNYTYLCDGVTLDFGIQLLEKIGCVLGAETSKMLVFQKEVHTQVCLGHDSGILDRELADTRQNEVLERFGTNGSGPVIYQQNVRVLERKLPGRSPQPQLPVVPAVVRSFSMPLHAVATHFFSFAVGPCTGGGRSAILSL
jgi:hypothetical protein